ncbi:MULTISPECIES: hypothetical protein [unclassified Bradyrhizobium]|nr:MULTISPECIES: hypothetical protein [unclassified Bradyrhizobium]
MISPFALAGNLACSRRLSSALPVSDSLPNTPAGLLTTIDSQ